VLPCLRIFRWDSLACTYIASTWRISPQVWNLTLRNLLVIPAPKHLENFAIGNQDFNVIRFTEDSWVELDVTEEDVEQMEEAQRVEA